MSDDTEIIRLLPEIRDDRRTQLERQQEAFALVQQQAEKTERLQQRAGRQ